MFYRTISLIVALVGIAGSIFYFIEDEDDNAKIVLFFSLYAYFVTFYVFKSFYYRKHKATFNEMFFVGGLPVIIVLMSILGDLVQVNSLFSFENIFSAFLNIGSTITLFITLSGLLSFPFFLFGLYLLLRSFIRYKFIRYTPYSEGGISATLFAIIISLVMGPLLIIIATILGDFLLIFYGISYMILGILGFFA